MDRPKFYDDRDILWLSSGTRANFVFELQDREAPARLLIRDRDSKFSGSFDEVFATEGVQVILTPIRSPKANAFAERCVKTLRAEVLDGL